MERTTKVLTNLSWEIRFFAGNVEGIEALAKPIFARGASPFYGSGPAAPFNGSGTAAPFYGSGPAAPFNGSGTAAPFNGSGPAAPLLWSGTAARIWFGYLNFYLDWNLVNFKI